MLSDPFLIFTMPSALAPLGQHSMGAGSGAANETHASRFVQQLFDAILFAIYNVRPYALFPCLNHILVDLLGLSRVLSELHLERHVASGDCRRGLQGEGRLTRKDSDFVGSVRTPLCVCPLMNN